jgi:putative ABC transport system permease protein
LLTLAMSQLRRRLGRTVAVLAGVLIAVSSFTVLTAATQTSQLQVVGTVDEHFRASYDVLVRPVGSQLPLERSDGLVRPNFLSDHFGGITLDAVERIRDIDGVEVAAPVAMVGYQVPSLARISIDVDEFLTRDDPVVLRVRTIRHVDAGLSSYELPDSYFYFTPNEVELEFSQSGPVWYELDGAQRQEVCLGNLGGEPSVFPGGGLSCQSLSESTLSVQVWSPLTVLVAAVDPAAEAALVGLDEAVVDGGYLPQTWDESEYARDEDAVADVTVPVLLADTAALEMRQEVRIEVLAGEAAALVPGGRAARELPDGGLVGVAGELVFSDTWDADMAYAQLVTALQEEGNEGAGLMFRYWVPQPVQLAVDEGGVLRPETVRVEEDVWRGSASGLVVLPPEAADVQFREIEAYIQGLRGRGILAQAVGVFSVDLLRDFSPLTEVPMGTYNPARLQCGDVTACDLLGGRDLLPGGSPAGYLQQAPMMLTTLDALPAFYRQRSDDVDSAPISAVRVRVEGITGFDEESRERVRLVAEAIALETGLDVDITMGASPTVRLVSLPAGDAGRPELLLSEAWTRKGVAAAIVEAVDRKSVILFGLVLLVCALFVGNASASAVRARRGELGVLAAVGWHRPALFAAVLLELAGIGLVAGALGTGVAFLVGGWLELVVSWQRALLAIPIAVGLAVISGLLPAWSAARASPMAALRPPAATGRRSRLRLGVVGFALANLRRRPGRALLGSGALLLAVGAFTVMMAVMTAFEGTLSGTLLGDAIAVQIRGVDVAAVVAMLVLAVVAVADVLYLNLRDRAGEFAALRATGWPAVTLARLVTVEGVALGVVGSSVGAAAGVTVAAGLAGWTVPAGLVVVGAGSAAAGVLLAALATVVPIVALQRQPTVRLLAEE